MIFTFVFSIKKHEMAGCGEEICKAAKAQTPEPLIGKAMDHFGSVYPLFLSRPELSASYKSAKGANRRSFKVALVNRAFSALQASLNSLR